MRKPRGWAADLLLMSPTGGKKTADVGFNSECDLTCNGSVNVGDLLFIAATGQFGGACL